MLQALVKHTPEVRDVVLGLAGLVYVLKEVQERFQARNGHGLRAKMDTALGHLKHMDTSLTLMSEHAHTMTGMSAELKEYMRAGREAITRVEHVERIAEQGR